MNKFFLMKKTLIEMDDKVNTFSRSSGVLIHISSLPGPYGIGEIGNQAKWFIDILVKMNQKYWQFLPTNYPENYHSPYDTNSAFAQNPLLISLDNLLEQDLIQKRDLSPIPDFSRNKVEFEKLIKWKIPVLRKAALKFLSSSKEKLEQYEKYCFENSFWLEDYALFMVLKEKNDNKSWLEWNEPSKNLDPKYIELVKKKELNKIQEIKILQYLFYIQWVELKKYANSKGVQLIGDIPIYVSYNSADVWKNKTLFKLDSDGKMIFQSGCPPDNFMLTGQVWGHPIYDWVCHDKTKFIWWCNRMKYLMNYVDIIRVDHFNGFAKYWEIPAEDANGLQGQWKEALGESLLQVLYDSIKNIRLIAEDLGEAAKDAGIIRRKYNIPGMQVLQFSFDEDDPLSTMENDTILYTGTHDNETSVQWYNNIIKGSNRKNIDEKQNKIKKVLQSDLKDIHWSMISFCMSSTASIVVFPVQDLLGLGEEARMNTPGTIGDQNWTWRMEPGLLDERVMNKMSNLTKETLRK